MFNYREFILNGDSRDTGARTPLKQTFLFALNGAGAAFRESFTVANNACQWATSETHFSFEGFFLVASLALFLIAEATVRDATNIRYAQLF